jgi:hypothetical protein
MTPGVVAAYTVSGRLLPLVMGLLVPELSLLRRTLEARARRLVKAGGGAQHAFEPFFTTKPAAARALGWRELAVAVRPHLRHLFMSGFPRGLWERGETDRDLPIIEKPIDSEQLLRNVSEVLARDTVQA